RADELARLVLPHAAFVPLIRALRRDDLRKVHALQAGELASGFDGGGIVHLLARHDATRLRALLSQQTRELARVDARDRDDATAFEERIERLVRAPTAREKRQIANDEPSGINLRGFEVF